MKDGAFVSNGSIVAVVYGFSGTPPDGQSFVEMAVDGVTPGQSVHAKAQQITPSQFLGRIPPAALPTLWSNPQTGVMLLALVAAKMIDLTDPAVQSGINGLVPSVLTADQAAAILDH